MIKLCGDGDGRGRLGRLLLLKPPREGELLLLFRSTPPTEGGGGEMANRKLRQISDLWFCGHLGRPKCLRPASKCPRARQGWYACSKARERGTGSHCDYGNQASSKHRGKVRVDHDSRRAGGGGQSRAAAATHVGALLFRFFDFQSTPIKP